MGKPTTVFEPPDVGTLSGYWPKNMPQNQNKAVVAVTAAAESTPPPSLPPSPPSASEDGVFPTDGMQLTASASTNPPSRSTYEPPNVAPSGFHGVGHPL